MYKLFGLTIKEWLYIAVLCVLFILGIGMIAAYYQDMEKKVVENETDIKWLRKQNAELQNSINKLSDSISTNSQTIERLAKKSEILEIKGKQLSDSIKKIKQRYYEIPMRVDTLDVDGIRLYFSNIPPAPEQG